MKALLKKFRPHPIVLGFITAALLIFLNDRFLYESVVVISSSMRPTLLPNERVFLRKWGHTPARWDVVVSQTFNDPDKMPMVKRIVGLPSECIELLDGWRVRIDGTEFAYDRKNDWLVREANDHWIQTKTTPGLYFPTQYGAKPYCLGNDEIFVLGDNRLASEDSRVHGPIRLHHIIGRVEFIWYSFDLDIGNMRWPRLWTRVE